MADFTMVKDHTYTATLSLSWIDSFADNTYIVNALRNMGFQNVVVSGGGGFRHVTGTWTGPTITGEPDSRLSDIRDDAALTGAATPSVPPLGAPGAARQSVLTAPVGPVLR